MPRGRKFGSKDTKKRVRTKTGKGSYNKTNRKKSIKKPSSSSSYSSSPISSPRPRPKPRPRTKKEKLPFEVSDYSTDDEIPIKKVRKQNNKKISNDSLDVVEISKNEFNNNSIPFSTDNEVLPMPFESSPLVPRNNKKSKLIKHKKIIKKNQKKINKVIKNVKKKFQKPKPKIEKSILTPFVDISSYLPKKDSLDVVEISKDEFDNLPKKKKVVKKRIPKIVKHNKIIKKNQNKINKIIKKVKKKYIKPKPISSTNKKDHLIKVDRRKQWLEKHPENPKQKPSFLDNNGFLHNGKFKDTFKENNENIKKRPKMIIKKVVKKVGKEKIDSGSDIEKSPPPKPKRNNVKISRKSVNQQPRNLTKQTKKPVKKVVKKVLKKVGKEQIDSGSDIEQSPPPPKPKRNRVNKKSSNLTKPKQQTKKQQKPKQQKQPKQKQKPKKQQKQNTSFCKDVFNPAFFDWEFDKHTQYVESNNLKLPLTERGYISKQIVDSYAKLLLKYINDKNVTVLPTDFYINVTRKNYKEAKKILEKYDIYNKSTVYIPLYIYSLHWALGVYYPKNNFKTWIIYDSFHLDGDHQLSEPHDILNYFFMWYGGKNNPQKYQVNFKLHKYSNDQHDVINCGVFCMQYMRLLMFQERFPEKKIRINSNTKFSIEDLDKIRQRIAYELSKNKITENENLQFTTKTRSKATKKQNKPADFPEKIKEKDIKLDKISYDSILANSKSVNDFVDDNAIFAYLNYLNFKQKNKDIAVLRNFVIDFILDTYDENPKKASNIICESSKELKYMKSYDSILIPMRIGINNKNTIASHWILSIVEPNNNLIKVYDSGNARIKNNQILGLKQALEEISGNNFDVQFVQGLPLQNNGWDCGVYVMEFARRYINDMDMKFSQKDIPNIKKRIRNELKQYVTKKLLFNLK